MWAWIMQQNCDSEKATVDEIKILVLQLLILQDKDMTITEMAR